jgi:hypothetical protein
MADKQELSVREKKELVAKEEKTIPGRHYVPYADIYETDDALAVVLEMPGVEKKDLNIALENDVLRVDGQIEIQGHGAGLYRVQHRPLRAKLHAVEQGRSGEDQRQPRGRRVDAHPAEGQGRPAAEDHDRVNGIAVRRTNDETAATASRRFLGLIKRPRAAHLDGPRPPVLPGRSRSSISLISRLRDGAFAMMPSENGTGR